MKAPCKAERKYRGLSLPATLLLTAAIAVAAIIWWKYHQQRQESQILAQVRDHKITVSTAEIALRAKLWRHDLKWPELEPAKQETLRKELVEELINEVVLSQHFKDEPASPSAANDAFQQFLKQFESPDQWTERATLQGLNEAQIREQMATETRTLSALNKTIESRRQPVTDSQSKQWYEANQNHFLIPESARASQIFLTRHDADKPDRSFEITQVHQFILSGEKTFSSLAVTISEDDRSNKRGGDLGWFSRARVPEDFARFVFSLNPGQTSQPFQTHLGWHIVQLKEKRPARTAKLEEVKAEITALLEDVSRKQALDTLLVELRQQHRVTINQENLTILKPTS